MIQVADTIAAISDASKHSPISGGGSSVPLLVLQLHSSWTVNSRIVPPLVNTYQLSSYLITRVLIFRATVSRLHASSTLLILTLWILDVTCCHDGHGHCHFIGLISLPLPATPPQIKRGCLAGSTSQRSRVFSSTRNVAFPVILSNQSPRKTFHSNSQFQSRQVHQFPNYVVRQLFRPDVSNVGLGRDMLCRKPLLIHGLLKSQPLDLNVTTFFSSQSLGHTTACN